MCEHGMIQHKQLVVVHDCSKQKVFGFFLFLFQHVAHLPEMKHNAES